MTKFINPIGQLKEQKKLSKPQLYLAAFGILLFLGVAVTLPLLNSPLNKNQNIIKSNTAAACPSVQTEWVPQSANFHPLTDAEAIARICPNLENKPANAAANGYLPSASELNAYLTATNQYGQTPAQENPYTAYVTGACAASTHSTDDLIQCTAAKWGIPTDWVRAQMMNESTWLQSALGDERYVGTDYALLYPDFSRKKDWSGNLTGYVWESLGISQVKWRPDGSRGRGTEQLRWKSVAFNLDYYAANVRFYYDDPQDLRSAWGDSTYVAGEDWWSIAGWYQPYPWHNSGQSNYIAKIQDRLTNRTWEPLTPASTPTPSPTPTPATTTTLTPIPIGNN